MLKIDFPGHFEVQLFRTIFRPWSDPRPVAVAPFEWPAGTAWAPRDLGSLRNRAKRAGSLVAPIVFGTGPTFAHLPTKRAAAGRFGTTIV